MTIMYQMKHLNSNIICSLSMETTGPRGGFHDIIRFCVIPLNNFLLPEEHLPFYMDIVPRRVQNIDLKYKGVTISKAELCTIINETGHEASLVADRFGEWIQELNLAETKRI